MICDKIICSVDPLELQGDLMERASNIITGGGVVVFPTKCLYGIAVDPFNDDAVNRVFEIKQRPRNNPILVLINERDELESLVKNVPETALILMESFWPGDVTIVFEAIHGLPGVLTAHTGKIGIRMSHHPVARALIERAGTPITGTSANISGGEGISTIKNLNPDLMDRVDLILDAGQLKGGKGSTIVDITNHRVRILREGGISAFEINAVLAKNH